MRSELDNKILRTHYFETFKNANDSILLMDSEGNIIDANDRALETYGYTLKELIGRNVFDFRKVKDRLVKEKTLAEILEKGELRLETEHVKKSGESFFVGVSARCIEIEGRRFIQSTNQDITSKVIADRERIAANEILNKVLSNIHYGILLVNEKNEVDYANEEFRRQFDLKESPQELKGLKASEILPRMLDKYTNPDEIAEYIKELIKTKQPVLGKEINIKGGKTYAVDFIPITIHDDSLSRMWIHRDITEKKKAEQMLSDSEEKYYKAYSSSPYALILTDLETGQFLEVNKGFEIKTGYKYEEAVGKTADDLNLWFDIEERNNLVKELAESKIISNREITVRDKFGKSLTGLYSADIITLNGRKYILASINDITETKEAEKRLIESEEKYRILAENINDVIWTLSPEGKFLYISPSVEKLRGYTVEEVMNQEMNEVICPGSLEIVQKSIEAFFENYSKGIIDDSLTLTEIEQPCKDGSTVWTEVAVSAVFDENNEFKFFLGVSRDISERKKAENQISESEKELRVIFDNAPAAMLLVNEKGEILNINKTGKTLYGGDDSFFISKQCGDLLKCVNSIKSPDGCGYSAECSDCVMRKTIMSTIETGKEFNKVEISYHSYRNPQEGKKTVLISASIAAYAPEKRILVTIDDITDRKNLENELIAAKEKAEEMYKIKTNFLANMSHELRTPMVGILGFSEILAGEVGDSEMKHYARMINQGGARLMDTLNLILDLSLVESNKLNINITEFNLISAIDEVIGLFQKSAAKKGLYLVRDTEISRFNVTLDKRLTIQILNNLINNAVKYTLKGGVVVSIGEENINGTDYAVLRIKDTGIGIPEEKWELVWDEFRQVSEGYNRTFEGTGLGLSITKKFVEKLGGSISIEMSRLDEGTTFKVILPVKSRAEKERPSENIRPEEINPDILPVKESRLPEVLYVEDEVPAYILVRSSLKNICSITHASTGNEAVDFAGKNKYDFILMDINLGNGIDGIQTAKLIRKIEGYGKTPIVAVTAFAMKNEKEDFLKNGCTHYISKPFLKKELIALVKNVLKTI